MRVPRHLYVTPLTRLSQNFDAEISAVVAENVWDTPERQKYLSETIVEHLYRQGMLSVAEDLCQVSCCRYGWWLLVCVCVCDDDDYLLK